jgi:putative transposase
VTRDKDLRTASLVKRALIYQPVNATAPAEGLFELADARAAAALRAALASADREQIHALTDTGQVPLLLAISDNGPQMRSHSTREILAGMAIATRFGRPGVPQDQAWIETLFGHVKGECHTWRRSATPPR